MKNLIVKLARHPVLSNLMMLGILVSGVFCTLAMQTEFFPEFDLDLVTVTVPYPGAKPTEIEQSICQRIEEEIQGIDGIKRVTSSAAEGVGTVIVELRNNANPAEVKDEITDAVDRIDTFPEDAEEPVIRRPIIRQEVLKIAITGDVPEATLRELAEGIRQELLQIGKVSQVDTAGVREPIVSIEIGERALRKHGLTFEDVRRAVVGGSLTIPAGTLRGESIQRRLTVEARKYTGREYEEIPVLNHPDGSTVLLGEIAIVRDTFEEDPRIVRFNGKRAVVLSVLKTADQDALELDAIVKDYIERKRSALPAGIEMTVWGEYTKFIRDRIDLLLRNGAIGLCLVVLALWIFLNMRLAFWVALGIPISFAGGLVVMFVTGQSINMISLFALIMATGLIVDDAIIIGENAYAFMKRGHTPRQAAVMGTLQVMVPVFATVATTCVAFAPLLVVPGVFGKFMRVIPLALIATLLASLVEAFFILPAHLSHTREATFCDRRNNWLCRQRRRTDAWIEWVIHRAYTPFFRLVLRWRLAAFATAAAVLLLCVGLQRGGFIEFIPFPDVDSDILQVDVAFPYGTPPAVTEEAVGRIESAIHRLDEHFAPRLNSRNIVQNVASSVGESLIVRGDAIGGGAGPQAGSLVVELIPAEDRGDITSEEVIDKWRELVGRIPGADSLSFGSARGGPGSADLQVRLRGDDLDRLAAAATWLKAKMADFEGVEDLDDDFVLGPPETQASRLKPEGESLGLTIRDVGLQLRYGFDGAEAFRIQRGRDEVKVKIRYPQAYRRGLGDVESIRIRTASGDAVPLARVAVLEPARDPAVIRRQDRRRVVNVTADIDNKRTNAGKIRESLEQGALDDMMQRFPGVSYSFEGTMQETSEAFGSLAFTFPLAVMVIYLILAAQFGSYVQPAIIMITIPFGIVGAMLGHFVMGLPLTILSVFGIVAVSGVVVNDALVLIEFINIGVREGKTIWEAVAQAGPARFRAITLTSTTTVAGLLPIILERSMQARFLIPMAVAISGGLIVATFLNLLITPGIYLMVNDVRRFLRWLRTGQWPTREDVEPIVDQLAEKRHDKEDDQTGLDDAPLPEHS